MRYDRNYLRTVIATAKISTRVSRSHLLTTHEPPLGDSSASGYSTAHTLRYFTTLFVQVFASSTFMDDDA